MGCEDENAIFRGDDTDAFNQSFLRVNAQIPDSWTISKAEIKIGSLPKWTFDNPTFPLFINPSAEQTAVMASTNNIYMCVYDALGRKMTCQGTLTIKTKAGVIR